MGQDVSCQHNRWSLSLQPRAKVTFGEKAGTSCCRGAGVDTSATLATTSAAGSNTNKGERPDRQTT